MLPKDQQDIHHWTITHLGNHIEDTSDLAKDEEAQTHQKTYMCMCACIHRHTHIHCLLYTSDAADE